MEAMFDCSPTRCRSLINPAANALPMFARSLEFDGKLRRIGVVFNYHSQK